MKTIPVRLDNGRFATRLQRANELAKRVAVGFGKKVGESIKRAYLRRS